MLFIYFILFKSQISLTHSSWVFQNHRTDYKETWYRRKLPFAGPRHSLREGLNNFSQVRGPDTLIRFKIMIIKLLCFRGFPRLTFFNYFGGHPRTLREPKYYGRCTLEPNFYSSGNERCCSKREEVWGRRPSRDGACTHDSTGTGYSKLMTSFNFISRVELAL